MITGEDLISVRFLNFIYIFNASSLVRNFSLAENINLKYDLIYIKINQG